MAEPWKAPLEDPDIKGNLNYINDTPEAQSILYDLDLLPEQTMTHPRNFLRTMAFVAMLQRMEKLERLAALLGATWFYGDFTAETASEREQESLMNELGFRFKDKNELIAILNPKR